MLMSRLNLLKMHSFAFTSCLICLGPVESSIISKMHNDKSSLNPSSERIQVSDSEIAAVWSTQDYTDIAGIQVTQVFRDGEGQVIIGGFRIENGELHSLTATIERQCLLKRSLNRLLGKISVSTLHIETKNSK